MIKTTSITSLLLALCILSGCAATGQDTPPLEYQQVIEFDSSLSKDELYSKARLWMAEAFVDSEEVIELADKESGVIVGNGAMEFTFGVLIAPMPGRFSLRIDVKDGKVRTTYDNFKIYHSPSQYSSGGWSLIREGTPNGYPDQALTAAKSLNSDLKAFVEGSEADSDW